MTNYSFPEPVDRDPTTTTPHDHFKYEQLAELLRKHGWSKQLLDMVVEPSLRISDQHIEWWNRGNDVVLVSVMDKEQCTLWMPTTRRRVINVVTKTTRKTKAKP